MAEKKIIIKDEDIPIISNILNQKEYKIISLKSSEITKNNIKNANALLIRTATQITKDSIKDSKIRIIGTLSSGVDHIDTKALQSLNIELVTASGANANAVAEYVMSVIAHFKKTGVLQSKFKIGIIGVGNIGRLVKLYTQTIGAYVLCNDPLRDRFKSTPLSEFKNLDIITIHTPLTVTGLHKTHHIVTKPLLEANAKCILINTSRAPVLEKNLISQFNEIKFCLDVWHNEPNINIDDVSQAYIATPHIAGYSIQAKNIANTMVQNKVHSFLSQEHTNNKNNTQLKPKIKKNKYTTSTWETQLLNNVLNPLTESNNFKNYIINAHINNNQTIKDCFLAARKNYKLRNEFANCNNLSYNNLY